MESLPDSLFDYRRNSTILKYKGEKSDIMEKNVISQHKFFDYLILLLLLVILSLPQIVWLAMDKVFMENPLIGIFYSLFTMSLFAVPLCIFFKNIKYYLFILIPVVSLCPIAIFHIYLYGNKINSNILAIVFESNYYEAIEFLSGFVIILLLSVILISAIYIFLIIKSKKNLSLKESLYIFFFSLFFILTTSLIKEKDTSVINSLVYKLKNTYPIYLSDAYRLYRIEKKRIENRLNNISSYKFNAFRKDSDNIRKIYVLVIGESSRYDHWGINGYFRQTSPHISKRKNIISFQDVIASGTITRVAIPLMITPADTSDFDKSDRVKNVLSAFKEAGYKTAWISNQEIIGIHGTRISMHAREADDQIYINKKYSNNYGIMDNKEWAYDGEIEKYFRKIIAQTRDNYFIIIHTIGSHIRYDLRYPDEFDVFKPSAKSETARINDYEKKDSIINSYDNSIFYTDYVLDKLISVLEETESSAYLTYISDHGEDLFDEDKKSFGHGQEFTRYRLHVPMLIWYSEQYGKLYADKIANLELRKNKKISQYNTFSTLLDMANIGYNEEDSSRSVANKDFIELHRYFLSLSYKGKATSVDNSFYRFDYDQIFTIK